MINHSASKIKKRMHEHTLTLKNKMQILNKIKGIIDATNKLHPYTSLSSSQKLAS